jgi:hypothetical protein
MLVAKLGDDRVEAERGLEHRRNYLCPRCNNPVVLHARIGGWVIPHFKHKPDSSCSYGSGETLEHRAVKAMLRDHFRAKGYHVDVEHQIDTRRADVFVPDLRAAFEVEFSPKETAEFVSKCRDYQRTHTKSVWILRQKRVSVAGVQVGKMILISMSRVLNLIYSKRRPHGAQPAFFAYDKNGVVVFRGTASPHMLYREYDEYSGAGGHEYSSRSRMWLTVKDVIRLEPPPRLSHDEPKPLPVPPKCIEVSAVPSLAQTQASSVPLEI